MVKKCILTFILLLFSFSVDAQEKKKIFLANLNIGKSDITKERQIDAIISEILSETTEVLSERDAYKYMVLPQKKKPTNCKPNDIVCIEREIEPYIKNTQKCIQSQSSSPQNCYIPYLKKYDTNTVLLIDIQSKSKETQFKLKLLSYFQDSFETQNLFEKNILPFQLSFYLKEVPIFLLNPGRTIKVPKDLYYSLENVNLKGLTIETFKKLDLELYNFYTRDEAIDALIEEQKPILKQGDTLFLKSEFSRARIFYSGIIKAIEVGLRPSGISKVSPYILGLKSRIGLCDVNEFINKINETDSNFNQSDRNISLEDLIEIMKVYNSLYSQLDSIEYLDKNTGDKVRKGLLKRTYLLKTPAFQAWEKRTEELFYQFKFKDTIEEYQKIISTLSSIFQLLNDINFYEDKYFKLIEDTKIRGKKLLKEYIKSRGLIAERKNINFISQAFIENEKINDIKIYQIISENILSELHEILNDPDYEEYLNNGIKRSYNRVVFQINQSRKNINNSYEGKYIPYKTFVNDIDMEFQYVAGFENLTNCKSTDKDCFTDYNDRKMKVVTQKSFYISKFEVTQKQYISTLNKFSTEDSLLKALKSSENPSFFKACGADCPVESISYTNALEFVKALCKNENYLKSCPYRIPTQVEWEFASKGWNLDPYPGLSTEAVNDLSKIANYGKNCTVNYSGTINLNEIGTQSYNPIKKIEKIFSGFDTSIYENYKEDILDYFKGASTSCGTNQVGLRNPNFFNIYDLSGNVSEFCIKDSSIIGTCGGSWASMNKFNDLKSISFMNISQNLKHPTIGLRILYAPNEK